MNISTNLTDNIKMMKELLPIGKSYDFVARDLEFAGRKAYFICINGLCDMDVFQSLFANLQNPEFLSDLENPSTDTLIASKMGYSQIEVTASLDNVLYQILSGPSVLFVDRFPKAIIIPRVWHSYLGLYSRISFAHLFATYITNYYFTPHSTSSLSPM